MPPQKGGHLCGTTRIRMGSVLNFGGVKYICTVRMRMSENEVYLPTITML
jgi:hypothetical protein